MSGGRSAPIEVVAGIIVDGDRVLVGQRADHVRHPGKWEFPGGKVEPGELRPDALLRELHEELGIDAVCGEELWRTTIRVDGAPRLRLFFLAVPRYRGTIVNRVFAATAWCRPSDLGELDLLDADRDFVRRVRAGSIQLPTSSPIG